jgi:hypothetical protein
MEPFDFDDTLLPSHDIPALRARLSLKTGGIRNGATAMQKVLEALAFSLVIGGQFLAALVMTTKRALLYPDAKSRGGEPALQATDDLFEPLSLNAPEQPANENAEASAQARARNTA